MQQKSKNGYTLIEMSMSLVIFALLATSLLAVLMRKSDAVRYRITNERIAKIEEAIQNFVDANGYIPCPAALNLAESSASFGVSVTYPTYYCSGLNNFAGTIPTKTLNLSDALSYDGWERKFTFQVATGMGSVKDYNSGYYLGDIAIVDVNGYERTDIYRPAPNNYGAAYVIVSYGPDGVGAQNKNDTNWPSATLNNTMEQINYTYRLTPTYPVTLGYMPISTYVQNNRTSKFAHIVAYKRKIDLGFPVKPMKSPIKIPANICTDAKAILSTATTTAIPSVTSALWDASTPNTLAVQLYKSAYAISKMCDNPPPQMPQNRDKTQSTYNCGTNPYIIRSANLQLWLDPNDTNSNYNNTTGAPCDGAATVNGSPAVWCDKSGNNRNGAKVASPSNTKALPNVTWPKYWMGFNGSTQKYTFANWTWIESSPYTIFVVHFATTNTNSIIIGTSTNATNKGLHMGTNVSVKGYYLGQYAQDVSTSIPRITPSAGAANLKPTMPTILVASNTNVATSSNLGMKIAAYSMDGKISENRFPGISTLLINSTGTPTIGGTLGGFAYGYVGEIIIYNADLTAQERASIVSYLQRKWFSNECP